MPTIIFWVAYSVFSDNKVVMVPAPAINGKARGTIETVSGVSPSLNMLSPKTISMAIQNITSDPAIANEATSKPITLSKVSPAKRNTIMRTVATIEAFSDCICPAFLLSSITTGIEPSISMMAKRTIEVDSI